MCSAQCGVSRPPLLCAPRQVAGILSGDIKLIGESLDRDVIIEPVRGPLIPGMMAVKEAAKAAGAARLWRSGCRMGLGLGLGFHALI